jgi:hypothetical protein
VVTSRCRICARTSLGVTQSISQNEEQDFAKENIG